MTVTRENYRNILFSNETHVDDFYRYANVKDLGLKFEICKEDIHRCRTIGILSSEHGRFYLSDMDESGVQSEYKLQVSLVYLKAPPPSTVLPYPVQVFGILQWKNRPVIFIKVLQVLSVSTAIRIRDVMSNIAIQHLSLNYENQHSDASSTSPILTENI